MRYRTLGKTGLKTSLVGFGASPLGNVFGDIGIEDGRNAVRHAVAMGINLFDVSPYYGITKAEERLGDALKGIRNDVLLMPKCGRYGSDNFDFSPETITREFDGESVHKSVNNVYLLVRNIIH